MSGLGFKDLINTNGIWRRGKQNKQKGQDGPNHSPEFKSLNPNSSAAELLVPQANLEELYYAEHNIKF